MTPADIVGIRRPELERKFEISLIVDLDSGAAPDRSAVQRWVAQAARVGGEVIFVGATAHILVESETVTSLRAQGAIWSRFDRAAGEARGELLLFARAGDAVADELLDGLLGRFRESGLGLMRIPVRGADRQEVPQSAIDLVMNELALVRTSPFGRHGERMQPFVAPHQTVTMVRRTVFSEVGGFRTMANGFGAAGRLSLKVSEVPRVSQHDETELLVPRMMPWTTREAMQVYRRSMREFGFLRRHMPELAVHTSLLANLAISGIALIALIATGILAGLWGALIGLGAVVGVVGLARLRASALSEDSRLGVRGRLLRLGLSLVSLPSFLSGYLKRDIGEISIRESNSASSSLRILVLNWRDRTHPRSGGAENYVYQLAQHWIEDGAEVSWLTQRPRGGAKHEVIEGIEYFRVGGRLTQYYRVPLKYLKSLRGKYDVIVDCENGIPFFSPFFARVPQVLIVHHVHQEIFRRHLPPGLKHFAMALEAKLMPFAYRKAQVVAVSNETRDDLLALGFSADSVSVIKNGVVLPTSQRISMPKSSVPSIVCMGRLVQQKSVDLLIKAAPILIEKLGDLRIDILGQGPERSKLERLAWSLGVASKVHFHGYVPSSYRDELLGRSWIAACPSAYEGWGLVCMEASAFGLPVVASDVPGLRESVRDGETGRLFPYGDAQVLANTIVELVNDASAREALGAAGRQWAGLHSWRTSAERFYELLCETAGSDRLASRVGSRQIIDIRDAGHREVSVRGDEGEVELDTRAGQSMIVEPLREWR
ncbi:MAG: glycosyltransferase family 4 protein [Acidimicrobiales bacterium]